MTERLYYNQPELTGFQAIVVESTEGGRKVYLDRTAFYPSSGGQPHDRGEINGVAVLDVVDEEDRVAHILETPLAQPEVEGRIDWKRRFDHMQQHTGQHLLSAVLEEMYSASTVSFHMGQDVSTIDVDAAALSAEQLAGAERRANDLVFENRPVTVSYEDASEAQGLRKASGRTGTLRIVSIAGLDRSACGGTHVSATGVIGPILLRKVEKIRGNVRVEFLCGGRAIDQARADFDALGEIARAFSSPAAQTPALVSQLLARSQELEKSKRKLATELAAFQGRQLYEATASGDDGLRRASQRIISGGIPDELRAFAQKVSPLVRKRFFSPSAPIRPPCCWLPPATAEFMPEMSSNKCSTRAAAAAAATRNWRKAA
ncbi:MAG: alanyl-tRNA editing protein [Candidatus Solibacter usitatus]|nr:alanyl-tRNA editing protein [Candidatus Solibacter usitatus]